MLPIGNRPAVDYVVQACIDNGITDIAFVVNSESSQLREYYQDNHKLETFLKQKKVDKEQLSLSRAPKGVRFRYVVQPESCGYGTSVPLAAAYNFIGKEERYLYLSGDDFLWSSKSKSFDDLRLLIEQATTTRLPALLVKRRRAEKTVRYGVVNLHDGICDRIDEKVNLPESADFYANVSKYVADQTLLKLAISSLNMPPSTLTGEYMFTDVINQYIAQGGYLAVAKAKGDYIDVGDLESWLEANTTICKNTQS
jgi:UTP--glucose-1-phosphate uridylyltransferase